jgi:hypothetical protein
MKRQQRGWLQIALDIHMTCTTAFERPEIDQQEDIIALREHLLDWEVSRSSKFDELCYQVMAAALEETALTNPSSVV